MVIHRHIRAYALLITASVVVFALAGHFAATALLDAQRARQLQLVNQLALRISEAAVSFGAAALEELGAQGTIGCDAKTLQAIRLHVYQRGAIKDIRVVNRNGNVLCSAYAETLEFDKEWPTRDHMLPTRDNALRLFRVDQFFGTALGILKDIDQNTSVVAILGFNGNAFDILPADLHDHSELVVELGDGVPIVTLSHLAKSFEGPALVSQVAESARYPLRTVVRVEEALFRQWNNEFYLPIMAIAALLGLAFGVVLCRAVDRSDNPIAEIDRGLAAGEFVPYLQPIFDLNTRAVIGCEVLARWVRGDATVIPPSRFIRLAESSGRIEDMTWQLLQRSLNILSERLRQDKSFKLSINVTAQHLATPDFIARLRDIVRDAHVSPRQIVLELTERQEIENLAAMAETIRTLHDYGFKVAMDDVGTGHNGLSQIQALGANVIKIDKFFIDSICSSATAVSVVEMLVKLAHDTNMSIVAEGIERDDQVAALLACGVTHGQGYLVSPPLPAAEFAANLALRTRRTAEDGRHNGPMPRVA